MYTTVIVIAIAAISAPSPVSGYRDEAERLADQQAEQFKTIVFKTLKSMYGKDGK